MLSFEKKLMGLTYQQTKYWYSDNKARVVLLMLKTLI